jgi:hypothetical protein
MFDDVKLTSGSMTATSVLLVSDSLSALTSSVACGELSQVRGERDVKTEDSAAGILRRTVAQNTTCKGTSLDTL